MIDELDFIMKLSFFDPDSLYKQAYKAFWTWYINQQNKIIC